MQDSRGGYNHDNGAEVSILDNKETEAYSNQQERKPQPTNAQEINITVFFNKIFYHFVSFDFVGKMLVFFRKANKY